MKHYSETLIIKTTVMKQNKKFKGHLKPEENHKQNHVGCVSLPPSMFNYLVMLPRHADQMPNSVNPDQAAPSYLEVNTVSSDKGSILYENVSYKYLLEWPQ